MLTRVLTAIALCTLPSCAADVAQPLDPITATLSAPVASEVFRAGDPISAPPSTWKYIAFPHTACMDGQPTGLGININPSSDRLLIFIDWTTAAALNALTALLTPRSWGPADLDPQPTGVLDRGNVDNPFRDWNLVFIPACTGDLSTGDTPNGYGGAPQLGAANFREYLARLQPTFSRVGRVVLGGSSSGSVAAAFNWLGTQDAFGEVPVDLLADSGLPLGPGYMAECLVERAGELWNLRASLHPACSECDVRTGKVITPLLNATFERLGATARAAFLSYDEDATMKTFFALGEDHCAHLDELTVPTYPTGKFPAGIADLRARMAGYPNVGFFVVPGSDHTFLKGSLQESYNGVKLSVWLRAFADGSPTFKSSSP